ncbi:lysine N(6)-hydroxylase/L-ornithine N(5)-oxygenase family protein [Brenneria izbisi]|uniref:SidA/IucD/PvdA family monooxygenase n=1 Tax=Brenneria izbisi TaxID=2939450 RepID=A0AA42C348_9GAMM|nr:SidA/IucD/PvdA family monooxygenase [Brenneria izbisi]MCV9878390.1 SidA/IucD/PvdA family monooxygenase [Brenneria izbisi]MCV9881813.1 SidA/IucD/PvdA family monooxygenase [Brenneria izbisi]
MKEQLDFIGIGIGPFNLSISALAYSLTDFQTRFFERKSHFAWHPGMLVPDCHMQTSFLKDLVSAVDPCNPFSFINYLVQKKKFYRFLTTEMRTVSRDEFSDYLGWAADNMDNLSFDAPVYAVDFDEKRRRFIIETQDGVWQARHVCVGIGKQPYLPECVNDISDDCFHASEMNLRKPTLTGKTVTIVGGGQSGADLFLNILRGEWGEPTHINWVSRRNNFNALDEAPFANEYFTPDYVTSFLGLEENTKQNMLAEQKMTSDGITAESLLAIYRELYHRFDVLRQPRNASLLPSRSLIALDKTGSRYQLKLHHKLDNGHDLLQSDVVIFATGYRTASPAVLSPLHRRLSMTNDGNYRINPDFTLDWQGPADNHLFAVNSSMQQHGISEPQLSLMAWRSANILNRAIGREHFDLSTSPSFIEWRSGINHTMTRNNNTANNHNSSDNHNLA